MNKKGFTLLELLIVIGILAILAAVTVLVINPAQLLKRARDSQRMSDLATLQTAIGLYMTDVTPLNITSSTAVCIFSLASGCGAPTTCSTASCTNKQNVDGSGWVPINFTAISGGSPLGNLPIDPSNSSSSGHANQLYYVYKASSLSYEINTNLESDYYTSGNTNKEDKDGGDATFLYEVGNTTTLLNATSDNFYK